MKAFKINSPHVIHDTIEGEVVVINLETGTYYSLRGSASAIWAALQRQPVPGGVITELSALYTAEPAVLESAVTRFISELVDEGLLVPRGHEEPMVPTPIEADMPNERRPFDEPVVEKFDDMQDLILLDPVFEVDDAGWPSARQETA